MALPWNWWSRKTPDPAKHDPAKEMRHDYAGQTNNLKCQTELARRTVEDVMAEFLRVTGRNTTDDPGNDRPDRCDDVRGGDHGHTH
jgi:hypothetical protein